MALSTTVALEFLARNRAASGMRSFERGITTVTHRLRGLMTTALAVAGIGGFGYMIKRQMEAIDATAKLSDRLGIATEALVGLQHAAKISGVENETLNKSLEIFSRRLGEVDMGIGQARYSLDKLGLNYKELIGLKMDEAFAIVADRIKDLSTQSEKAAAANYLFGRSGQQLLNLFEKGSKGLKEYQEFVIKTGYAFTRIDAAKVEAANDALTNTKVIITGLFRVLTIEIAPYIESAATAFNEWAISGEGAGAKVTSAFEISTIAVIKFAGELQKIPNIWLSIKARTAETVALWEKWTPIGQLNRVIRELRGIEAPGELAARYRAGIKDTADEVNKAQQFFERIRKGDEERAAEVARRGARPVLGFGGAVEDVVSAE